VEPHTAGTSGTVKVAGFSQRSQAEFAVQALAAHGIDAWAAGDDYGGMLGLQLGGVAEVRVRAEDEALAREVLDGDRDAPLPGGAPGWAGPLWPVVAVLVLFFVLVLALLVGG
jgi:hypothetical protein